MINKFRIAIITITPPTGMDNRGCIIKRWHKGLNNVNSQGQTNFRVTLALGPIIIRGIKFLLEYNLGLL